MDFELTNLGRNSSKPSAVNELTAKFAADFREGIDINLGVGYVNDQTIPADVIGKAYQYIISHQDIYRNALNYGGGEGSPNLIRSIKKYYLRNHTGMLNEDDWKNLRIMIGANGATSLLDAFSDIIKPGIVITSAPYYYIYTQTLQNKGFNILPVKEDKNGIIPSELDKALKTIDHQQISFIYLATVNNPSTSILSNERRSYIVKKAEDLAVNLNRKIPVIFDKAYEDIIHNPDVEAPVSGLKFDSLGQIFEIGTLSKVIAPALRIGYLICKNNLLCSVIVQRTSDIGFSAPLINQEIASWLLDNYVEIQRKNVNEGYKQKARIIKEIIEDELGEYLQDMKGGDAAFYFYLTFKEIKTDEDSDFFKFLSRTTGNESLDGYPKKNPRLVYIPGVICNSITDSDRQLRLSYGFEDVKVFKKAIKYIRQACEYSISASDKS